MIEPGARLDAKAVRRQVERLRELPTLPAVVGRIVELLERPDADLSDVAALIETDQVLTAHLLRLANTAFYGLSGTVGTVTQALTVLGTTVTRSLLYGTAVLDLRIDLAGFWEHSIGTAVAAGALAKHLALKKPEEVSGAGLLHDIGKVVLYKQAPEAFAAVLARTRDEGLAFRDAERALLGVDHAEVASWLLTRWRFPPRLLEPIVCHHRPTHARAFPVEAAVVHVANTLVRAVGYGFGGDGRIPQIAPEAWRRLGLSPDDLDQVLDVFERDLGDAQVALHG
ncbi:MAG: HDOD domain-containing protein [bacterium]|nr:HDOD domain-containing protein [bacterium]